MNILILHPNMPGQYKHLARALGASGQHRIFFITKHKTAEIPASPACNTACRATRRR